MAGQALSRTAKSSCSALSLNKETLGYKIKDCLKNEQCLYSNKVFRYFYSLLGVYIYAYSKNISKYWVREK